MLVKPKRRFDAVSRPERILFHPGRSRRNCQCCQTLPAANAPWLESEWLQLSLLIWPFYLVRVLRAVVGFMFLGAVWITENLSAKLARRGGLPIRIFMAVVGFVIVAVPELTKTSTTAEPACYGSAETTRPFSLHPPADQIRSSWELLH